MGPTSSSPRLASRRCNATQTSKRCLTYFSCFPGNDPIGIRQAHALSHRPCRICAVGSADGSPALCRGPAAAVAPRQPGVLQPAAGPPPGGGSAPRDDICHEGRLTCCRGPRDQVIDWSEQICLTPFCSVRQRPMPPAPRRARGSRRSARQAGAAPGSGRGARRGSRGWQPRRCCPDR